MAAVTWSGLTPDKHKVFHILAIIQGKYMYELHSEMMDRNLTGMPGADDAIGLIARVEEAQTAEAEALAASQTQLGKKRNGK